MFRWHNAKHLSCRHNSRRHVRRMRRGRAKTPVGPATNSTNAANGWKRSSVEKNHVSENTEARFSLSGTSEKICCYCWNFAIFTTCNLWLCIEGPVVLCLGACLFSVHSDCRIKNGLYEMAYCSSAIKTVGFLAGEFCLEVFLVLQY